jgi:hypothetical protein
LTPAASVADVIPTLGGRTNGDPGSGSTCAGVVLLLSGSAMGIEISEVRFASHRERLNRARLPLPAEGRLNVGARRFESAVSLASRPSTNACSSLLGSAAILTSPACKLSS